MTMAQLMQYCLSGVTVGSIYAIVAIGFNIIYNTTGIINFAQGEFVVLGALMAVSFTAVMPLALAVVCAVTATTVIGALVEMIFIRPVKEPSVLRLIIITIGVSIILREGARHIWGERVRTLPYFTGNESSSIAFLGAHISPQIIWVLGVSALVVAGLGLFFARTLTGRAMRACAANRTAARLCGINVGRMVTLSFMLSAGIGALAGCVISPVTQTEYEMGAPLAIKGFTVAVLGGLGNSMAAVAAGLFLGLIQELSIVWLPLAYQDVISMTILLVILFFRPSGIFGSRETSALKEF
jgi:branched-chain amino acid transport system permease protein